MIYRRQHLCSLTVLVLVGTAGCGKQAVHYNNALVTVTKKLEEAGKQYASAMAQSKGDIGKLWESHARAVKEMEKLVKEGRAITVPDAPQAKEMNQAFLEFLKVEEKVIRVDLGQLVMHAANKNEAAIRDIVNKMESAEKTAGQKLKDAQVRFAKANHFVLE
jgi:hypothetical protein